MVESPRQGVKMCQSFFSIYVQIFKALRTCLMLLGDMSKSGVFTCSPLYGVLIVILTSSLFGVFSHGLLVKEAAATSEKVYQHVI